MTGVKLSLIYVANMELVYWSVRSSSKRGRDKGGMGVFVILAHFVVHLIREDKICCKIQVKIFPFLKNTIFDFGINDTRNAPI